MNPERDPHAELREWYDTRLKPKLVAAARSGVIPAADARHLDWLMAPLLQPVRARTRSPIPRRR